MPRLWLTVSKQFDGDATPAEVETAIAGHYEQVRHLPADVRNGALLAELTALAKQYGNRQEIEADTIAEAVRFVVASFPWLGVREIRTAFRWHASGKTATSAGEMYGGVFTVRALGAILTAYNDKRKKIVAAYIEKKSAEEMARKEAVRREQMRRNFETNLQASIDRAREQKMEWQDIPADWHDWMKERGVLTYSDEEKSKAWKEAKMHALREQAEDKNDPNPFKAVAAKNKDYTARRIVIAKKLLVHKKIIL